MVAHRHVAHHTDVRLDVGLQYARVFCGCPWPPRLRVFPPETAHAGHGLARRGVLRDASGVSAGLVPALLCDLLGRPQGGRGSRASRHSGTSDSGYYRRRLGGGVSRGGSGTSGGRRVLVGEDLRGNDITARRVWPVRRRPARPVVKVGRAHGTVSAPVLCSHLQGGRGRRRLRTLLRLRRCGDRRRPCTVAEERSGRRVPDSADPLTGSMPQALRRHGRSRRDPIRLPPGLPLSDRQESAGGIRRFVPGDPRGTLDRLDQRASPASSQSHHDRVGTGFVCVRLVLPILHVIGGSLEESQSRLRF